MAVLAGCASRVDVRGIGSGGAPPFYELRGHNLTALSAQAQAVCPGGFRVARQWQRVQPAEANSGPISFGRTWLEDKLFTGYDDQAQMTIQCGSGPAPFVPIGLPVAAAEAANGAAPLGVLATPAQTAAVPERKEPAALASPLPPAPAASAKPPLVGKPSDKKTPASANPKLPFSVPGSSAGRGAM